MKKFDLGFIVLTFLFVLSASYTVYSIFDYVDANNYIEADVLGVDVTKVSEDGDDLLALAEGNVETKDLELMGHLCDPFCLDSYQYEEDYLIFEDIDTSHKNAYAIEKFYDSGLIRGYDDGTFRANDEINRAELLKIVTDAKDIDFSGQYFSNCFDDVSDQWFAVPVCFAKESKWVSGYGDGSFRPSNSVTRAEALKMAMEAFSLMDDSVELEQESAYMDVENSDWVFPYLVLASDMQVVSEDGRFKSSDAITRSEFVQMLFNIMHGQGII